MSTSDHKYSRSFFGPVPEIVPERLQEHFREHGNTDVDTTSDSDEQHNGSAIRLIDKHAFTFFLREGGRPEDWNEGEELSIRRKMINRWLKSEWGKALRKQADDREATGRWVGNSFEIGKFLGLDILNPPDPMATGNQSQQGQLRNIRSLSTSHLTAENVHDVYVSSGPGVSFQLPIAGPSNISNAYTSESRNTGNPASNTMASVHPSAQIIHHSPGEHHAGTFFDAIHKMDDNMDIGTLASAAPLLVEADPKEVVMRGIPMVLVRVCYSDINFPGQIFNEEIHRTSRLLEHETYTEFLAVWRKDRIELYEDYGTPLQEWITGHKRLAYIIPVSPITARLSLYSFVDLTFSITCRPTNHYKDSIGSRLSSFLSKGLRIYIFKLKCRSRAYDWIWMLWLRLGCHVPKTIDIKNPRLNATISVDLPDICDFENERLLEAFSRQNLVELGRKSLSSLPDWSSLIERAMLQGGKLELAWQIGTNLDWIWLDTDVHEKIRRWAVLCGIIVKEAMPTATLELRLAEHYPTHIYLKNGMRFDEPLGAEGYLKHIRPNSSTKHQVYLSTHDGNLFVLPVRHAYPPVPPGFFHRILSAGTSAMEAEIQRGAMQIMHASGVCDFRNIFAVRRAFQLVPSHAHDECEDRNGNGDPFGMWYRNEEALPEDNEDNNGEVPDDDSNKHLHMRRSFELLLRNRYVIRFEAHSCQVALEWINRLRALIAYWKERHRIDAQHEMNLAQASEPRLTPRIPKYQEHPSVRLPNTIPHLLTMYPTLNWCMIKGCRPIVRGGKLFMKKGLRGQYKLVQMFLVTNHLVRYLIRPNSLLHPAMKKKICLSDAYVCSGYWAALTLPGGEFNINRPPVGRRYQDGLETGDREEDSIFMVCYRSPARSIQNALYHTDPSDIPSISAKRKTVIFRTRSKLERDSWCWAINCEIEKTVRAQKDREDIIRNNGNLIP
ncbi:hypothetical protein AX15_000040 [Amanita polypyramis BW_CC]|nr:hypothetical protein AX15_000040 [Amanita polypyramis BW_CC]